MSDYRHDIEKYLRGELTPAERNALERKALHDPFLADALEGAEQINAEDFLQDVASLQSKMANRKPVSVWLWPARIAAGLVLIAVASFTVWMIMQPEPNQNLAFEKKSLAPAISSDSVMPPTGEPSSPPIEQPKPSSTAGPARRDQDVASRATSPLKSDTKPIEGGIIDQNKNEPASAVALAPEQPAKVAEPKAEEIAVTESLALKKAAEDETERAKTSLDDAADKKLAQRSAKRKDSAAKEAAPAASSYPYTIMTDSLAVKTNLITGRVTAAEDGSPLPGVNVAIKGTANGTSTDADGKYQLDPGDAKSIVYSFIGLQSKEVEIKDQRVIDVTLPIDAQQLNEVVVTAGGLTAQRRELGNQATENALTYEVTHPQNGMIDFQQFLKKNVRYPQAALDNKTEGRVTIQFTIEPDGRLTNFIIIKGIGSGCDEELIRLIKGGPLWLPTKQDGQPVRDTAKVRFKFELPK